METIKSAVEAADENAVGIKIALGLTVYKSLGENGEEIVKMQALNHRRDLSKIENHHLQ